MTREDAIAAVAAHRGLSPKQYDANEAPRGSIHEGLWYVHESDPREMLIDDCVWIVLPNNVVARGIPVGNPIHAPTPRERLHQDR